MSLMIHRAKKRGVAKEEESSPSSFATSNPQADTEEALPFVDEDIAFETKEEKSYTKTEINRMSTAELQQLADSEGIENARETSGGELKKILIEKFGL